METPGLAEKARAPFATFGELAVPSAARSLLQCTPQRAALMARLEHLEAQLEARTALSDAPLRHNFELFQLLRQMQQRVEQFQAQLADRLPQLVGAHVHSATDEAQAQIQSALEQHGAQLHAAVQQTVSQAGAQLGETMQRMQEAAHAQAHNMAATAAAAAAPPPAIAMPATVIWHGGRRQ